MSDDGWGNDGDEWGASGGADTSTVGGGDKEAKKGGDSGCRKCGEDGHFARECPTGGGGGSGDNKCRNCRKEGHMASDCPEPEVCRRCRKEGHIVADCPEPETCRRCRKEGHKVDECPEPEKCFNCREEGHSSADCPEPQKCRRCKEEGHQVADCPKPMVCMRCGGEGHMVRDCTEEEKTRQWTDEDGTVKETYVPKADDPVDELFKLGISAGINFNAYDKIEVKVTGENKPEDMPIDSFAAANLRPLLMGNISKSEYKVPTPVQKYAIPIIMADRDLMACAQTGSGKTASFMLPIIHKLIEMDPDTGAGAFTATPQALIVTPTRELALQIYNEGRKFAQGSMIKCVVAYGGTSTGYQARKLQEGCNILVATPGRLLDYVEKGKISFKSLHYLVLDEADRMADQGFLPEIEKCVEHETMPSKGERKTLLFSATFPDDIQEAAQAFLDDYLFLTVGMVGGACADVAQTFEKVAKFDKRDKLDELLNDPDRDPTERTLIFSQTKKNCDFLSSHLSQAGLPTTSIHGDRFQREREEALYDFKKGDKPILVATSVAARGLDIRGVAHVINYDVPDDVDEYVHRIGRTGRVGNPGRATSFIDEDADAEFAGKLVQLLNADEGKLSLPDWLVEMASGAGAANGGGEGSDEEEDW